MKNVLAIISSFSGGVLVGGALTALITLIQVFPRLIQITQTRKYLKIYENMFIVGTFVFSMVYFTDYHIKVGNFIVVILGLVFGTFVGIFGSAIAETLDVLPIISKKFKIKKKFGAIVIALLLGKTLGSLYYFIFFLGG